MSAKRQLFRLHGGLIDANTAALTYHVRTKYILYVYIICMQYTLLLCTYSGATHGEHVRLCPLKPVDQPVDSVFSRFIPVFG